MKLHQTRRSKAPLIAGLLVGDISMKQWLYILLLVFVVMGGVFLASRLLSDLTPQVDQLDQEMVIPQIPSELQSLGDSLKIQTLRQRSYPGSEIVIEQTLTPGSNYQRYLTSYQSDGLKIYALMTVPNGSKPASGWPVIVFNHGYIPPEQYRTTERYVAYVDYFARSGYIVFRSDYRGHGNSEGEARGGYGAPDYTIDVLNAVSSLKQHPDVDDNRIGMWGHSMGGYITLRSMVITQDIKAGVIWGGVVADYPDLMNNWRRRSSSPPPLPSGARRWRQVLQEVFGSPEANPEFWNSISANFFVKDISGPVQLHHAKGDESVPWEFSQGLSDDLKQAGKEVDLHLYEGDDHDITRNFSTAMKASLEFFDRYVKGS